MGVQLLGSWVGCDPPQLLQAKALADSLVAAASAAAAAVASAVQRLPPAPYGDSQGDGTGVRSHRGAARSPVRFSTELPDTMKRMGRAMAAYSLRFNASREIPKIPSVERTYTHIHMIITCEV